MFCPSCGYQNPEGASKCLNCQKDLPVTNTSSINYGGFWRRAVAFIIDVTIINIVLYLIGMALVFGMAVNYLSISPRTQAEMDMIGGVYSFFYFMINMIFNWLYFALFEGSSRQATPGKMLLGIKVTDLEGRRISYARATGRYWAKVISFLTLGIGFIMAGFTKRKQALHDMIASTLVMKSEKKETGNV